jgi:hypothetical protein
MKAQLALLLLAAAAAAEAGGLQVAAAWCGSC